MTNHLNNSDAHAPLHAQDECNQSEDQSDAEIEQKILTEAKIERAYLGASLSPKVFKIDGEKRSWRIPWIMLIICLMQLFIYFFTNDDFAKLLMFNPDEKWQLWRYLTYTLLHSDLIHLALNISLQFFIGLALECEQGHWKVAIIYITGGISGSLATLILQPELSLLGASASIYSLLMSHIPHLVKNFSQLSYRYFRIIALVVLWLSDAVFTVYHFLINNNSNPRICLDAHIAGGVAGFLMGFAIYNKWQKGHLMCAEREKMLNV